MAAKRDSATYNEKIKSTGLVGCSENLYEAVIFSQKASPSNSNVFFFSEFGTELKQLCRLVHGGRKGRLIEVECGFRDPQALLKELLQDWNQTGVSRLDLALGGTLVLKDVDALCDGGQKFLKAFVDLIEREKFDVKLISTTKLTPLVLKKMVDAGEYDAGLFYRIHWHNFHLLPLRERREDIIPLAQHFRAMRMRKDPTSKHFTDSALKELESRRWIGNLDSLETVVNQLFDYSSGDSIRAEDLRNAPSFV